MRHHSRKIGDVAKVKGGKRLPKGMSVRDEPTEHSYLRVVDFGEGGINRSNIKYIDNEAFESVKRYTIDNKDVYISIAGTIGRVGVVPSDLSGANLTENAAKITEIREDIDHSYLMYYLRGPVGQGAIKNMTGGTSQPKLALCRIADIEFPCLPVAIQHRIASILCAYDNLIENNQRRIHLLEQAARLLYKEWFIHLRFPGHEHVKVKNNVPEGWEIKPLVNVAPLNYGKALKEDDRTPGKVAVYGSSGIVGRHDKALVNGPTIIVGRKGNVGSVYWSANDCWPIDTVYYVAKQQATLYLFYALLNTSFISTDVAVPGLNRDFAHSRLILVPSPFVLELFEEGAIPLHRQIEALGRQNASLIAARDLLLPRLMNCDITV